MLQRDGEEDKGRLFLPLAICERPNFCNAFFLRLNGSKMAKRTRVVCLRFLQFVSDALLCKALT